MSFELISHTKLVEIFWSFGIFGKIPHTNFFRLLPNGKIYGATHPNESFWELRPDSLLIKNQDGQITTEFSRCYLGAENQLVLTGKFVGSNPEFDNCLEQRVNHHRFSNSDRKNPFNKNFKTIDIARDTAIGDVLMVTPVLRELKRLNPDGVIRFYTRFRELVSGLPYIDEIHPFSDRPEGHIEVDYVNRTPAPIHLAVLFGDQIGVEVRDVRPDCVVDHLLVTDFLNAWKYLPSPRVVVVRSTGPWTPNKRWPDRHWTELLMELNTFGTIIEIGDKDPTWNPSDSLNHYVDLRGLLPISELIAIIAAADLFVGPVTGPMHVAAAVRTPSVVIIGGYEHPVNTHYDGNLELYSDLTCSPCYLRDPCPFEKKCLQSITSAQVFEALCQLWNQKGGRSHT